MKFQSSEHFVARRKLSRRCFTLMFRSEHCDRKQEDGCVWVSLSQYNTENDASQRTAVKFIHFQIDQHQAIRIWFPMNSLHSLIRNDWNLFVVSHYADKVPDPVRTCRQWHWRERRRLRICADATRGKFIEWHSYRYMSIEDADQREIFSQPNPAGERIKLT